MKCLCGKPMKLILTQKEFGLGETPAFTHVWACPPDGCGRVFIESTGRGLEIGGTWYYAEQNDKRDLLG